MQTDLPDLSGRTILQVIPDLAAGGAERTVIEVAEALAEAGARALVASRGGRLVAELEAVGGRNIPLNMATKNPLAIRANAARLARLIRNEGVDLIHARSRAPAWSARAAAQRTAIPYVTTYHGVYSARSAPKRFYNAVMARGDRVIANSEWTARHVREEHGVDAGRLVTIPRGVDMARFDPQAVSDEDRAAQRSAWGERPGAPETIMLLPGRLTRWKGQLAAIDALALYLNARNASAGQALVRLVLLGDAQGRDGYRAEIDEAITAAGLAGQVTIAPHTRAIHIAYAAADLVLAPSLRPEAFGRTAAEASAMERPVIAFAHGGALETVIDGVTGRLVQTEPAADRTAGLSQAMADLLNTSTERRQAMGRAGRAHIAAHFTKRGLQNATLTVYAELINPSV